MASIGAISGTHSNATGRFGKNSISNESSYVYSNRTGKNNFNFPSYTANQNVVKQKKSGSINVSVLRRPTKQPSYKEKNSKESSKPSESFVDTDSEKKPKEKEHRHIEE